MFSTNNFNFAVIGELSPFAGLRYSVDNLSHICEHHFLGNLDIFGSTYFPCVGEMMTALGSASKNGTYCLNGLAHALASCLPKWMKKMISASTTGAAPMKGALRRKSLLTMWVLIFSLAPASGAQIKVDLDKFRSGPAGMYLTSYNGGGAVAGVGDHNGDGFDDFIMGASSRAIIVMKANSTYAAVDADTVVSGQYFRVIKGQVASPTGLSVGGIGDINGDGYYDVIIGNRNNGYEIGYVVFGMKGPFVDLTIASVIWTASSLGFSIVGPYVNALSLFMDMDQNVGGLGDVNGDGVDDFAVSARNYPGTTSKASCGVVWIIWGKKAPATYANIDLRVSPNNFGSNGIYFTGAVQGDYLGWSVRTAGDFNGDGVTDFMMSAPHYDPYGRTSAGAVYLMHGSKTALATMDMSTFVTGSKGVRFHGAAIQDRIGYGSYGVGDINGDGIDDIAFGSENARSNAGIVYVIYGKKTAFTADIDLLGFVYSTVGFTIYGSSTIPSLCYVAPAGDINRDGVNDILVGGYRSYVVFGQKTARTKNVVAATDDVIYFATNNDVMLGAALAGGQDFTGDGIPDIVLGAKEYGVYMLTGATVIPAPPTARPTALPTSDQSPAPTAGPTLNPTIDPSAPPTLPPSLAPTELPTLSPTLNPTVTLTAEPSAVPSMTPSQDPSMSPTLAPTAPTVHPTLAPSVNPSMDPSATPSAAPSLTPSVSPSVNPSVTPTMVPSAVPSMDPTVHPTLEPTLAPTMVPSVHPTASPTAGPTLAPTTAPSMSPTVSPTVAPTIVPTAVPTKDPTAAPSPAPTIAPTAAPSVNPTAAPTAAPSITPTAAPSKSPTVSPTATPTILPTVSPSAVPTARPTVPAVKDYEVVVDVNQEVTGMTQADYDAQKAAYNSTIQHAVADATDGVTPERVTDIAVEEEEEEGGRAGNSMRAIPAVLAANSVRFKYRITVRDPAVTMKTLRAQLVQAVKEGRMDTALRTYAVQFGAPGLKNATVAEPQVTSTVVQRDTLSKLTGVQIALLVIGVMVALGLVASILWVALLRGYSSAEHQGNNHNMDLVL